MDVLSSFLISASGYFLPVLALWLLVRCVRSMLREKYEPEMWAYFETTGGERAVIKHWESLIGSSKTNDIIINREKVAKTQATLIRDADGEWVIYDLAPSDGLISVDSQTDCGEGIKIYDGDKLDVAGTSMIFHTLSIKQREAVEKKRSTPGFLVSPAVTLFILTVFQAVITLQFSVSSSREDSLTIALAFLALAIVQWAYYLIMTAINYTGFEPEFLAFFLSTLGLAVVATSSPDSLLKQLIIMLAGLAIFIFIGFWLRDLKRAKAARWPLAAFAIAFLALNILAGDTINGQKNWLSIGGFSLQPSEFVKVAYVYVGAATLDRLFRGRNLFMFIGFSAVCVGALALMGDFGTALIFFATFLVISFLRSGNLATVILAVSAAVIAGFLVLTVKPYALERFSTWRHIWEVPYDAGYQQTRALSAAASGGLFGVGAGNGWLHQIFAADTDMVFCLVAEELGLIVAICAIIAIIVLGLFAVRAAAQGRSSFFVILACAGASMMMFQMALNVFGSVDLLPFTGVTFPFVSKGGSSLICCWGLLAFIKAADTRQNASFSVRRGSRRSRSEGDST